MLSRISHYRLLSRSRNLRTRSKVQARKIRVLSRLSKTFDSRTPRPSLTLHVVFPSVSHTLARQVAAIRQAAAQEQVRGRSANRPRLRSHRPAVPYRLQHPSTSAKAAADFSAVLLGCSAAAVAIPAAPRSGRRAPRRIYGPYDATWIAIAKMRLPPSPQLVVSLVGGLRMTLHVHHRQQQRSSESASLRKRRIRIKGGSAMALQLEAGVRVKDLQESVQPYKTSRLVPHKLPPLRLHTLAHHPWLPWAYQPCPPPDHQRQRVQSPAQNRSQICALKQSLARARTYRAKVLCAAPEVHHLHPDVPIQRGAHPACRHRRLRRPPVWRVRARLVTGRADLPRTRALRLIRMPMRDVLGLASCRSWRSWKASLGTIGLHGTALAQGYPLIPRAVAKSVVC